MTATTDARRRERVAEPTTEDRLVAAVAALRLTERNLDHLLAGGDPKPSLLRAWREIVRGAVTVAA